MQLEGIAAPSERSSTLGVRNGVLALSGYGVRVSVDRGHLSVSDNVLGIRRHARLARATARLDRLLVLGHSGTVTLDAMRWLHDIGASYVHVDADGAVVTLSAPIGRDDARLRRAQATSTIDGSALRIARRLLTAKLAGQRDVVRDFGEQAHEAGVTIAACIEQLEAADTFVALRSVEARAAVAYFQAWSAVPIVFRKDDRTRVPDHWQTFGLRHSLLSASPRKAINPANALLNYMYALLEAECRIALLTVGLDPGLGVMHADQPNRDSLALDLMEVLRPAADRSVLGILRTWTFSKAEFVEVSDGTCRLAAPLPANVSQSFAELRKAVAPVAEGLAQEFFDRPTDRGTKVLATRLTESKRSAARRH